MLTVHVLTALVLTTGCYVTVVCTVYTHVGAFHLYGPGYKYMYIHVISKANNRALCTCTCVVLYM